VTFRTADAEDLPFADDSFDVVLSTFGAMFTPDHLRPAREMLRVVRGGGRIGLANWTPEGFIGQLFKVIGGYIPAPAGLKSSALWGTESHIAELFGAQAAAIRAVRRTFNFRYRSAQHWIQIFRDFYGPNPQGVRGAGHGRPEGAREGHHGAARPLERRRAGFAGRPRGISRGRDREEIKTF